VKRLVIVGAGGHGAVVAEAAAEDGRWQKIVFLDDDRSLDIVVDYPVTGPVETVFAIGDQETDIVVALGDNRMRLDLCDEIEAKGLKLSAVVHPSARVSKTAVVSPGSVVLAGVIINARAKIGRACILNTGATIDHDCVLEDGAHISPGANLAGCVRIRQRAWIGIGSAIREGVTVGQDAIVGTGAAVVSNVGAEETVAGVPAKVLENR
jgi:sugar O-acyltransferase (sialic acid O-acetyltransferase NeuD family)